VLNLKTWSPFLYGVGGHTIAMKIRRARWELVLSLGDAAIRAFGDLAKLGDIDTAKDVSPEQAMTLVAAQTSLLRAVPEEDVRRLFEKLVFDVEGLQLDDVPVTTGAGLYEVADGDVVMAVLMHIYASSKVLAAEGKGSSSLSTSTSQESGVTPFPVPYTGNGNGTTPSIATADPETESSGVPAA